DNDLLAQKLRKMKNFGFAGIDDVTSIGTNAKMSEISAAMGLTSFEVLDDLIYHNRRNHGLYTQLLSEIPGYSINQYDLAEKSNYQYVIVQIDSEVTGYTRDSLVSFLHQHNVIARRYFYP